jgi:hypothetical protein
MDLSRTADTETVSVSKYAAYAARWCQLAGPITAYSGIRQGITASDVRPRTVGEDIEVEMTVRGEPVVCEPRNSGRHRSVLMSRTAR